MSWWEFRARVAGQVRANTPPGPGGAPPITPEQHDALVARFADV